jgi:hypothetical protein
MYKKAWDIVNYRDKYRNFPLASTVAMPLEIQPEHVYQKMYSSQSHYRTWALAAPVIFSSPALYP